MGSKSKPPPPPDYQALAQQQGAANKETAIEAWRLSNSPVSTPWGQRNLIVDPNSASGYRIEETLNPADQARLEQERQVQAQLLGLAPGAINSLSGIMSSGIDTGKLPYMVSGVNTDGQQRLNFNIPQAQYGFNRGQVQGNVNFDGLNPLESGEAVRNRVEKNSFDKWASRAEPAFDRQNKALDTRIANMLGNTSSPAAKRMREELAQGQNDARSQASMDAVLRGGEEASRQFGMGLQGRQQGVGETMQQATFRNQAQDQDFGQLAQLADLWNTSRGQDANLQSQQTGFNNSVVNQDIANAFSNANLANSAHQMGISNMAQLRQMPINEIMAILSGTQVNAPQFQTGTQTNWQAAPVYQAGNDAYQARVGQANARAANRQGIGSAIGGVAGAMFGGPAGAMVGSQIGGAISDRRLKTNIERVGTTPGGIPVYSYELFGEKQIGVMADEVPDDARHMHADGYWRVDYSKVR